MNNLTMNNSIFKDFDNNGEELPTSILNNWTPKKEKLIGICIHPKSTFQSQTNISNQLFQSNLFRSLFNNEIRNSSMIPVPRNNDPLRRKKSLGIYSPRDGMLPFGAVVRLVKVPFLVLMLTLCDPSWCVSSSRSILNQIIDDKKKEGETRSKDGKEGQEFQSNDGRKLIW